MPGADRVINNLDLWSLRHKAAVKVLADTQALEAENWMKAEGHQPWQNRTHHARLGLTGKAYEYEGDLRINLHHTAEYGVQLELSHNRRYAILEPTLRRIAPEFMEALRRYLNA